MKHAPKPIYYEMDSNPAKWGAVPYGCLPFVSVSDAENWAMLPDSSLMAFPPGMRLAFDIEGGDAKRIAGAAARIKRTRAKRPDLRLGHFGAPLANYDVAANSVLDQAAYDRSLRGESQKDDDWRLDNFMPHSRDLAAWRKTNDAMAPITAQVDAVHPCLYVATGPDAPKAPWIAGQLQEAQRIGGTRDVLPFVWSSRHESAGGGLLPIPEWKELCTLAIAKSDGLMLWHTWEPEYVRAALEVAAGGTN